MGNYGTSTHFGDLFGRDVDAAGVLRDYASTHYAGEALPDWLARQSRDLWGADHRDHDWESMARAIESEAAQEEADHAGE